MNLEIKLKREGKKLFGEIIKQDEELRNRLKGGEKLIIIDGEHNRIISSCSPKFSVEFINFEEPNHVLCIRGYEKEKDNKVFSWTYETEAQAQQAYKALSTLVEQVNEKKFGKEKTTKIFIWQDQIKIFDELGYPQTINNGILEKNNIAIFLNKSKSTTIHAI